MSYEKIFVDNYTMKVRLYPTKEQTEKIDMFFDALRVAYNVTFYEVLQLNPMVCTEPNKDGCIWPDFRKMAKKEWLNFLREKYPFIGEIPAITMSGNNGLFLKDGQKAWQTGMKNLPANKTNGKKFHFYNKNKPRTSFCLQISCKNIKKSEDNPKVTWIQIPKIDGLVKARGFNDKIWFGEHGEFDYTEASKREAVSKMLTVSVSKDNCGDYYASIVFVNDAKKGNANRNIYKETYIGDDRKEIGIDVGIKDIAITSDGYKVANKHFKRENDDKIRMLGRKLSNAYGASNIDFRAKNKEIRKYNKENPDVEPIPFEVPSNNYNKIKHKRALLERKIARKRDTYYHQKTAEIVGNSSFIGIEDLNVTGMMKNHKIAYALSDAAMSEFLSKVKYKSDRLGVKVVETGRFEPSSQICSVCGHQNTAVKNLSVRYWTCPNCGTYHDRDVNAAKNILTIAKRKADGEETPVIKKTRKKVYPTQHIINIDKPEIVIVFSKELSRGDDVRFVIVNNVENKVIDDAQGAGYRSIAKAKNCYNAKVKWSEKSK